MNTGEDFVKKIKPIGCVLFLALFVGFLLVCFFGGAPINGYAPPQDSEYYAEHLSELKAELEKNVFPELEGITACELSQDRLCITVDPDEYEDVKYAITFYYDEELFEFLKEE